MRLHNSRPTLRKFFFPYNRIVKERTLPGCKRSSAADWYNCIQAKWRVKPAYQDFLPASPRTIYRRTPLGIFHARAGKMEGMQPNPYESPEASGYEGPRRPSFRIPWLVVGLLCGGVGALALMPQVRVPHPPLVGIFLAQIGKGVLVGLAVGFVADRIAVFFREQSPNS